MTRQRNSPDQGNMTGRRPVRIKAGSILVPGISPLGMPWYRSKESDLKTMTRGGRKRYQGQAYIRTSLLKCGGTTVWLSSGRPRDQSWLSGLPRVRYLIINQTFIETPGPGAYRAQSDFGFYDPADAFTGGHPRSTTALKWYKEIILNMLKNIITTYITTNLKYNLFYIIKTE